MLDEAEIRIPCPKCSQTTKKTIAWIKANDELPCGRCASSIIFDREGLLAGLKKAEQSIAKFRESIGRLGKRR